eukprot:gene14800-18910_t
MAPSTSSLHMSPTKLRIADLRSEVVTAEQDAKAIVATAELNRATTHLQALLTALSDRMNVPEGVTACAQRLVDLNDKLNFFDKSLDTSRRAAETVLVEKARPLLEWLQSLSGESRQVMMHGPAGDRHVDSYDINMSAKALSEGLAALGKRAKYGLREAKLQKRVSLREFEVCQSALNTA